MMSQLPPHYELSPTQLSQAPTKGLSSWRKRLARALLLLFVLALILLIAVPSWRARVAMPIVQRLATISLPWLDTPLFEVENSPRPASEPIDAEGRRPVVAPVPEVTFTPMPTPHPASDLDFEIDGAPGAMRWQIAYPGAEREPGMGCAYLSFRLRGSDADALVEVTGIDAELVIYDGDFVFENYGRAPLEALRGLDDPLYYEIPAGEPACQRHRFADPSEYEGLEFRLSLLAGETVLRQHRGVLQVADAQSFPTVTPTFTSAPPTPTPFPQVRVQQQVNVRDGPGTAYNTIGAAQIDAVYPVLAVDTERTWYQIDFLGQKGWVAADLVQAVAVDDVPVESNVPPTPVPTPTFTPVPPTSTPTPIPTPYIPFLLESSGTCEPNAAMTYFQGRVLYESGDPFNGACVHVAYEGPRNTKCSGCDGAPPGEWGFAPFGNLPGKPGTTVRIYVVPCPEDDPVPMGGQNPETGFGPLAPVSPVWTYTIGESVQCTGITFQYNPPPPPPEEEEDSMAQNSGTSSGAVIHTFSGSGSRAVGPFNLNAGLNIFETSHSGEGIFSVWLVDGTTGENVELIASEQGNATPSKAISIASTGQYLLNVTADGRWNISIRR